MELPGLFDAFYNKLILRDMFGKIVPGFVIITSIILASDNAIVDVIASKMTVMTWIIAAGLVWLIGFALQYVGELGWALQRHPPLDIPELYPEGTDPTNARTKFHDKWARFQRVATPNDKVHAERLNVIREACGNGAISLGLSSLVLAVSYWSIIRTNAFPMCLLLTSTAVIAICLWRMHRIHVRRYGEFVRDTLTFHNANPELKIIEWTHNKALHSDRQPAARLDDQ